jgi:hypothetical protein
MNKNIRLQQIFHQFNIELFDENGLRNVIDVLEDLYLKLTPKEFNCILAHIAETEQEEGHIFDQARNKPYE